MPATAFLHVADPKEELRKKIGSLDGVEVFNNQVLCAIYKAPERTAGGIIRPDSNKDEDRYQSKVALILKVGPKAFRGDDQWSWPEDMGEGDWVYFKRSAGWNLIVNGARENDCVIVDDVDIKGRVDTPDRVW